MNYWRKKKTLSGAEGVRAYRKWLQVYVISPVAKTKCWQLTFVQNTDTFTFTCFRGYIPCWHFYNTAQDCVSTFVKCGTPGWFQGGVGTISSCVWGHQSRYVKPKLDAFLTLTYCFLCLNPTRPLSQCCHSLKFKIEPKSQSSCNTKKCTLRTFISGDWHLKCYSLRWERLNQIFPLQFSYWVLHFIILCASWWKPIGGGSRFD